MVTKVRLTVRSGETGQRKKAMANVSLTEAAKAISETSVLANLHRAVRAVESVFDRESDHDGPTSCQHEVLMAVATGERLSQTDICEKTGIDRSTLAEVVRRLVKKGLLNRRRTRYDARRYEVTLTPLGEISLNAGLAAAQRMQSRVSAALSDSEIRHMNDLLARLAAITQR